MKKQTINTFWKPLFRLINIAPHELPRVSLGLGLKTLFYASYTVGWTMLTAMLVTESGIDSLPLLYIGSGVLTILGTLLFAEIGSRFSTRTNLFFAILAGAGSLLAAQFAFSALHGFMLFLILGLAAHAIFFAQVGILLGLFIEDLFSPLESERAFSVIEIGEFIGGIAGGLAIVALVKWLNLPTESLTWIWLTLGLAMGALLFVAYRSEKKLPGIQTKTKAAAGSLKIYKTAEGARQIWKTPYLRGVAIFIAANAFFFTILNYQYTKAVDTYSTHHAEPAAAAAHESAVDAHGAGEQLDAESHAKREHLLTENLGTLHILFSLLALVSQLFFTSRIIQRFGIVQAMTAHPALNILASIPMALVFGLQPAILAKAAAEIGGALMTTSFYASFYALKESVRRHAKEFLSGIVKPAGAILGTLALLAIPAALEPASAKIVLNWLIVFSAVLMAWASWRLRDKYTLLSKKNMEAFGDHPDKFTAIEILSQRGHVRSADILVKSLMYKKESDLMKTKIIETLGRLQDPRTIPALLASFGAPSGEVKLAAVRAVAAFPGLGKQFYTQAFTRHRVISSLKELFESEDSKEIRSQIVRAFASMHQAEVVPFLLGALQHADRDIQADSAYVCGLFHDISVAYYLEPLLESEQPFVRANAIIALWQFPEYRLRLTIALTSLLEGDDLPSQKAAIHALGEIGGIQEKPRLIRYLEHEDPEIRLLAALALAKMQHESIHELIADFVLHEDAALSAKAQRQMRALPGEVQEAVGEIIHHKLSARLNAVLEQHAGISLEELAEEALAELKSIYAAAEEWDEVARIDSELRARTAKLAPAHA